MFTNERGQTYYERGDCRVFRYLHGVGDLLAPVFVTVSADEPLWEHDAEDIVKRAVTAPIFHNDLTCRYWMYDFKCRDRWCEMRQPDGVSPYDEMHLNIYS